MAATRARKGAIRHSGTATGSRGGKATAPERRCLVTRRRGTKDSLIRFVVGPDNRVLPDIAAKLPGRGIWLSAERDVVNTACARNLFAKGFRAAVSVDAGLAHCVEDLVAKRCLDLLGLARRAGDVTLGFDRVCEALATGAAGAGLIAMEAAEPSRRRLLRAAAETPVLSLFTSGELARALGREHVVYVAVAKGRNAARLVVEAGRLAGFRQAVVSMYPGKNREGMV